MFGFVINHRFNTGPTLPECLDLLYSNAKRFFLKETFATTILSHSGLILHSPRVAWFIGITIQ